MGLKLLTTSAKSMELMRSHRRHVESGFVDSRMPSDYHLFRSLQHYLKGKQFRRMEEISENISAFFALKPTGFYVKGIARLQERWEKVVEYEGDYFVD